jgi:hypothetical protein
MRIGILVVINAIIIIKSKGIAARRVSNPINSKTPHAISNEPVKYAQNEELLNPMLAKRPTPVAAGVMNFCKPSERKINPAVRRMRSVGMLVVLIILFMIIDFAAEIACKVRTIKKYSYSINENTMVSGD